VRAAEIGNSIRLNAILSRIGLRASSVVMELAIVNITSWNGITAHARLRPGAVPGRFSTKVTRIR
jgi:hypothetical protein